MGQAGFEDANSQSTKMLNQDEIARIENEYKSLMVQLQTEVVNKEHQLGKVRHDIKEKQNQKKKQTIVNLLDKNEKEVEKRFK